ncbi:MAG: hypothetical protein QOE93_2196 [Actinomycetota bacterium]|jgi:hypothetical protein|nr:hypothetical protein [Actinomycetota bacterium]
MSEQVRAEVEGATPDDDDIVADVPNNPGSDGGDLNEAGSEPAGRGE